MTYSCTHLEGLEMLCHALGSSYHIFTDHGAASGFPTSQKTGTASVQIRDPLPGLRAVKPQPQLHTLTRDYTIATSTCLLTRRQVRV